MAVALMNEWIVLTLGFPYQLHSNFIYVIIKNNIHAGDCSNWWRSKFKVNFLVTSQELKACQIIDTLFFQFTCSKPGDMTLVWATWGRSSPGFQFSLRLAKSLSQTMSLLPEKNPALHQTSTRRKLYFTNPMSWDSYPAPLWESVITIIPGDPGLWQQHVFSTKIRGHIEIHLENYFRPKPL